MYVHHHHRTDALEKFIGNIEEKIMTESSTQTTEYNNLEENTLSEEWTCIDKRDFEYNNSIEEIIKSKRKNCVKEILVGKNLTESNDSRQLQEHKEKNKSVGDKKIKQEDKKNEAESDNESNENENKDVDSDEYHYPEIVTTTGLKIFVVLTILIVSLITFGIFIDISIRKKNFEEFKEQCAFESNEKIKSYIEKFDQLYEIADRLNHFNRTWPKIQNYINGISEIIKNLTDLKFNLNDSLDNDKI